MRGNGIRYYLTYQPVYFGFGSFFDYPCPMHYHNSLYHKLAAMLTDSKTTHKILQQFFKDNFHVPFLIDFVITCNGYS